MKLYEVVCPVCDALYDVAESDLVVGSPGVQKCSLCGHTMASWSDRKLKAFRLKMSAQSPLSSRVRHPVRAQAALDMALVAASTMCSRA